MICRAAQQGEFRAPRCRAAKRFQRGAKSKRRNPAVQPIQFTLRRPLLDLRACSTIANKSRREIVLAIEEGTIRYAFNVGCGQNRREIRVLTVALRDFIEGTQRPARDDTAANLRAIVGDLFPAPVIGGLNPPHHAGETIRSVNFQRVTSINNHLCRRLIQARLLRCAPGVRPESGPTSLAVFVPNDEPVALVDYNAVRRVGDAIYSTLATDGLLPGGLLGLDCCDAGLLRDGLMRFEVRDRSRAVELIHTALAAVEIPREQYELASRPDDILAPYETAWLPNGRASALHGITDHELFAAMNTRSATTKEFISGELNQIQAIVNALRKSFLLVT